MAPSFTIIFGVLASIITGKFSVSIFSVSKKIFPRLVNANGNTCDPGSVCIDCGKLAPNQTQCKAMGEFFSFALFLVPENLGRQKFLKGQI